MPNFTRDDHRLFYREQGSGPLLLILPGNTASSASHSGELAYFGQRYHAVALDFWGTGQSQRLAQWPADWWTVGARDAAALVAHLGQERVLVMGCSGGATVALLMAIFFPERVAAVVADSSVEHLSQASLRQNVAGRSQRTPEQVAFWSQAHGADWEAVVAADSAMLLRFAEKQKGDAFRGRLGQITCPVLLTASLADPLLPAVGEQIPSMAAQIPDSRAFLTSQGDHPLMWSRPQEFRPVCDAFFRQVVHPQ